MLRTEASDEFQRFFYEKLTKPNARADFSMQQLDYAALKIATCDPDAALWAVEALAVTPEGAQEMTIYRLFPSRGINRLHALLLPETNTVAETVDGTNWAHWCCNNDTKLDAGFVADELEKVPVGKRVEQMRGLRSTIESMQQDGAELRAPEIQALIKGSFVRFCQTARGEIATTH